MKTKFLHSSTFFGKGMSCDKKKLHECTNETFDEIEDIDKRDFLRTNFPSILNRSQKCSSEKERLNSRTTRCKCQTGVSDHSRYSRSCMARTIRMRC